MKRTEKSFRALLFCIAMLMSFLVCNGNLASQAATADNAIVSTKDSMVVVMPAEPNSLDPHDNVAQNKHQTTRQIYETLVIYNEKGELIPWLAESWKYENDVTLVLHIRPGVYFHNGDELKASDVMFTLKRIRDDKTVAAMQVNRVDFDKSIVVDDYTMKLVTTAPYALQLPMLENPLCGIINQRTFKESGGDFFKAPIGTGPYQLVKFNIGDSVILKAFDKYWIKGQPYVKNVTIRYIKEASSRAIEAESAGADIVYEISANDVDRVRANPNINLVSAMGANTSYLYMNQAVKPFDDVRVREAIWKAVDIKSAIEVAYGSFGKLADGVISPGIDGRHPDMSAFFPKQDLEGAKALLAEAGFPNGFSTSISCNSSDQQRKDFCEVIQAQLAKVGINVEIVVMDSTVWASALAAGKGVMTIYGLTASTGEAGRVLFRWLPDTSEWPLTSWENPEYYGIINKALVTVDREKRNQLYHKCQEMLMTNYVVLPVWHKELNAACQPDVMGFRIMPSYEHHLLQTVYFK